MQKYHGLNIHGLNIIKYHGLNIHVDMNKYHINLHSLLFIVFSVIVILLCKCSNLCTCGICLGESI